MLKTLVKRIDGVAPKRLPLARPLSEELREWAKLHGWEPSASSTERLLVRQAVLNELVRTVPTPATAWFATPLDELAVEIPPALIEALREAMHRSADATFNFWGSLYQALLPQAQRRHIGQFWTADLIAEWMAGWLLQFRPGRLVDVGCGAGNFLLKAAALQSGSGQAAQLYGLDISPLMLNLASAAFATRFGSEASQWPTLDLGNYLEAELPAGTDAVICNPPYRRHHQIPSTIKEQQQAFFKMRLNLDVSRQATMAFYFLLKIIADLPEDARAAVIVPMEVLDARYGKAAKQAVSRHTTLSAIINFSPRMNAFQKVDVGASILLFRKGYESNNRVSHVTLEELPAIDVLLAELDAKRDGMRELPFGRFTIERQDELGTGQKWFSLAPAAGARTDEAPHNGLVVPLRTLAKVVRGIATGANDFFVLTSEQVRECSLEPYVVRTIHRNREVQDIVLDETRWQALADQGKRVWLLYLTEEAAASKPELMAYVAAGELCGYNQRSLVRTRKRWYLMERREVPPIFFTLLTRGNPRFILNQAGARPVNMFLLLYPNRELIESDSVEVLWALLNSRFSVSRLQSVSRTYGGNTLKVEPRELDNLPVINPLALSEDTKQCLKRHIAGFHAHRDAVTFTRQVDELVERTLAAPPASGQAGISVPAQLSLLECFQRGGIESESAG